MNDKEIIESYRDQVENLNETPPESCWNDISTQLDLDDTWDSISLELNRVLPVNDDASGVLTWKNQILFKRLISIVSPILIILFFMVTDNRRANLLLPEIQGIDISLVPVDQIKAPQNSEQEAIIPVDQTREIKALSKADLSSQPINSESKIFMAEPVPVIPVILHPEQSILDPIVLMPSLFTSLVPLPGLANANESFRQGQFLADTKLGINKFSLGISLTEKNTWLISHETFEGLDKQKLNTTKPKFLADIGIILRYHLSDIWSFEGTGFLLSKTGQSYGQYINGVYSSKSYELKYYSFELSSRRTLFKSLNINNFKFYSVTGMYVSFLNSAHKRIDQSLFDISPDFDPVDYGVILGYEIEVALFNRFAIAPGFRIKYGIPNIFADQPGIPDELHSTRNASLEFRLNLILPFSNY
jgi:hypothetical protein